MIWPQEKIAHAAKPPSRRWWEWQHVMKMIATGMAVILTLLLGFRRFYVCPATPPVEDVLATAPLIGNHLDQPATPVG